MPPSADQTRLLDALQPVLQVVSGLDLSDPAGARARLERELPIDGEAIQAVRALVEAGVAGGWLCPRDGGPGLTFGRVAKAGEATSGLGIDAVDMTAPGPGHTHPNGEVDLCFGLEGAPTFDGDAPGWTVYGPGSWHVPTVEGGRMAILYFLPEGAIRFEPKPG